MDPSKFSLSGKLILIPFIAFFVTNQVTTSISLWNATGVLHLRKDNATFAVVPGKRHSAEVLNNHSQVQASLPRHNGSLVEAWNAKGLLHRKDNATFGVVPDKGYSAEVVNNRSQEVQARRNVSLEEACKLGTAQSALWTANTKEENDIFWKVMKCQKRLYTRRQEQWHVETRPTPSSLRCGDSIMDDFENIIASYDTIVYIGDSITRQQFFTMVCLLDSSLEPEHIQIPNDNSNYNWRHNASNTSILYREQLTIIHSDPTFLRHTQAKSTPKELTIFNLGAHYGHSFRNPPLTRSQLQEAAQAIAERSNGTNATMFWVETVDFQWPTANGEYVQRCWECKCEALTPDRILGHGKLNIPKRYIEEALNQSRSTDCIPNCKTANWRNDLTNSVLQSHPGSKVSIIPVWKQLVSSGFPHARVDGDCTHKSTDALIAVVQQTLRGMKSVAKSWNSNLR